MPMACYMPKKKAYQQHSFTYILSFDEVAYNLGYGKGQIETGQRYIISLRLSFYTENYWKIHSTTPILLSFTRPSTFIGRHVHLEDVAILTEDIL